MTTNVVQYRNDPPIDESKLHQDVKNTYKAPLIDSVNKKKHCWNNFVATLRGQFKYTTEVTGRNWTYSSCFAQSIIIREPTNGRIKVTPIYTHGSAILVWFRVMNWRNLEKILNLRSNEAKHCRFLNTDILCKTETYFLYKQEKTPTLLNGTVLIAIVNLCGAKSLRNRAHSNDDCEWMSYDTGLEPSSFVGCNVRLCLIVWLVVLFALQTLYRSYRRYKTHVV